MGMDDLSFQGSGAAGVRRGTRAERDTRLEMDFFAIIFTLLESSMLMLRR
jgi:hypothetical protein